MRRTIKSKIVASIAMSVFVTGIAVGGNDNRAGQAGATEILINPWARSGGWMNCNTASVRGLEAQFLNVAGTAFTKKTELGFTHTTWLKGSDVSINSFGLSQHVGEAGALTLGIMSMDFGDIPVTTAEQPEGGLGTYKPQFLNIAVSYSKAFSNSIYGGLTVRIISESVADVRAQGISFDAGIQYVTGFNKERDNLKFGIALKNVGAPMRYSGDGLSFRGTTPYGTTLTLNQRADKYELPSLVNIGAAYDYKITEMHRLTFAGTFISNSFTKDQTALGIEYGFKKLFMLRVGYSFEKNGGSKDETTNAYTGLGAGLTVEVPIGKSGKALGIDYSYRDTNPFDGTHSLGLVFKL